MRNPTLEDVARQAGVSRSLVSLVMRGAPNVSDHRRRAVIEAAERLGYRPNANARNLAGKRTHTVGVVLNDLHNPFFAEIHDGVMAAAAETGYHALLATANRTRDGERAAIDVFLELRAEGVILVGACLPTKQIVTLAALVPVVLVTRRIRSPLVDTVVSDDRLGASLAVEHLVELGHRRIAHIDGGGGAGSSVRRAAYQRKMRDFGLEHEIRVIPGAFTDLAGARGVETLLEDRRRLPTAIFGANDLVAAGALDRLEDAGLRVPDDVSLVGYDNTALAAMHHMSLTSVDQPCFRMGQLAMAALARRLADQRAGPARHVLKPELVVRGSTGPAPAQPVAV